MSGPAGRLLHAALAAVPLAMVAVTCLDVVGRRFGVPLPGAIEIIELLMGVLVFGALPLVTADRGHVTVGLFDERLSARFRALRDRVVGLASAGVVAVIAWRLFAKALETASFGDRSNYLALPLAPLVFFMAAMAAASVAILLLQALRPGTPPAHAQ
jgi:TRAP-type C4-dicarboxylate transport system permease small subunit